MAVKIVMIIDDETETREFIAKSLKRKGFEIVEAANGADALEKIKEYRPDLIVSDVNMPKMDGFTFLEKIKNNPETQDIPVIMLTVRKAPNDLDKGILSGAEFYLPKPFSLENLDEFIDLSL